MMNISSGATAQNSYPSSLPAARPIWPNPLAANPYAPGEPAKKQSTGLPWYMGIGKSLLEFPAGIAGALGGAKLADRLVAKPAVKKILEKLPAVLGKNPTLLLGIPGFLLGGALAGGLISGIWQKSTNGKIDNKQLATDMFTGSVGM